LLRRLIYLSRDVVELCIDEHGQADFDNTFDRVGLTVKQAEPDLETGDMRFDGTR
jgi:hypothetical protein